jgi:hypothetical protein
MMSCDSILIAARELAGKALSSGRTTSDPGPGPTDFCFDSLCWKLIGHIAVIPA